MNFDLYFSIFAFVLGSSIGSFLNVCIYRMPRNLSVNNPRRSFCPKCNYQIPWWNNLPLISWLALRGKCANCGSRIAFRYFGVELLTGLLFLGVWLVVREEAWVLVLPYCIFVSLLVVATFIDFEHFIIPDEITWGGAIAGLLLSLTIPILQGQTTHLEGLVWSLIGAVTGYGLLWIVVELGKIAFGKKAFRLSSPASFSWIRRAAADPAGGEGSDADLVVGDESWKSLPPPTFLDRFKELFGGKKSDRGESWVWSETFGRESDRLIIKCTEAAIDGESLGDVELAFTLEELKVGDRTWKLEKVDAIKGQATVVIVPREAMGFGDVKFMACIGAFLGWKAVLFSIMAGSCVGAVVGIAGIVSGRREWSGKIPFGPYLALGSLIWFFSGPAIVNWYWLFATGPK